jgi:hypothetical protein
MDEGEELEEVIGGERAAGEPPCGGRHMHQQRCARGDPRGGLVGAQALDLAVRREPERLRQTRDQHGRCRGRDARSRCGGEGHDRVSITAGRTRRDGGEAVVV